MTIATAPVIELAKWSLTEYQQIVETGILAARSVEFMYGEKFKNIGL